MPSDKTYPVVQELTHLSNRVHMAQSGKGSPWNHSHSHQCHAVVHINKGIHMKILGIGLGTSAVSDHNAWCAAVTQAPVYFQDDRSTQRENVVEECLEQIVFMVEAPSGNEMLKRFPHEPFWASLPRYRRNARSSFKAKGSPNRAP